MTKMTITLWVNDTEHITPRMVGDALQARLNDVSADEKVAEAMPHHIVDKIGTAGVHIGGLIICTEK